MKRPLLSAALIVAFIAGAVFLIGYRNARADPVVRRVTMALPDWPAGKPPITIALMSDIHM